MLEFITEHAEFAVIPTFILYALAMYQLVEITKVLTKRYDVVKPWRIAMPAAYGAITGPFVFPWLFDLMGVMENTPIPLCVILGMGAGTTANVIYDKMEEKIAGE